MPHWERFDEQQRDKAIQKLASKSAGDPGLREGVRFTWERIVKKIIIITILGNIKGNLGFRAT